MNIIREFFFSVPWAVKYLMFLLCLFSIEFPEFQFWGLDNPDDNASIVLGLSTGSQTQNWVLDLVE